MMEWFTHITDRLLKPKVAGNLKNDIWKEISQFTVNVMDSIVQLAWVLLEFDQSEKYHVHA